MLRAGVRAGTKRDLRKAPHSWTTHPEDLKTVAPFATFAPAWKPHSVWCFIRLHEKAATGCTVCWSLSRCIAFLILTAPICTYRQWEAGLLQPEEAAV